MAKRERNPTYVVFEERRMNEAEARLAGIAGDDRAAEDAPTAAGEDAPSVVAAPVIAWVVIATDVDAKTPRDAIAKATADRPVDDRAGTFWAPLASAFRPRSREVAVLHEDRWT